MSENGVFPDQIKSVSYKGTLKGYSSEELHKHNLHQFLFISRGVSLLIDDKQQPQYGNSTAFIPGNVMHRSVVMGPELIFQTIFIEKKLFRATDNSIIIFNISDLGKALFDYLCLENRKNFNYGYNGQCLKLFLTTVENDIKNEMDILRLPVSRNPLNMQIVNHIHKNYMNKIRLDDFEENLHYTVRHASRIFFNEMKMTIFDYIKIYRIMMSTILLHDKRTTVQQIAFEVGYNTLSAFYKDFNSFFNISPNEYRNKVFPKKMVAG